MSKHQRIKEIAEGILERYPVTDQIMSDEGWGSLGSFVQERPNTTVVIYPSAQAVGKGWAKVHWPDKWDAKYGVCLALRKAAYNAARKIEYALFLESEVETRTP